uniref:Uncharacterized protein n=1 Tax=Nelumbo nucifera TaxID=4432 RepID=A0A822ZVT4_NELNU|nr:TPA_asm: hypothetical protein HUJ06_017316 [Nelumbo nucifera]
MILCLWIIDHSSQKRDSHWKEKATGERNVREKAVACRREIVADQH